MGLFDLFNEDKEKNNNVSAFDLFTLNELEQDEVEKGNNDLYDYDEEKLEDDDYYDEDLD